MSSRAPELRLQSADEEFPHVGDFTVRKPDAIGLYVLHLADMRC